MAVGLALTGSPANYFHMFRAAPVKSHLDWVGARLASVAETAGSPGSISQGCGDSWEKGIGTARSRRRETCPLRSEARSPAQHQPLSHD